MRQINLAVVALLIASVAPAQHAVQSVAGEAETEQLEALQATVKEYGIALMFDLPAELVTVPDSSLTALDWLAMTAAANDRVIVHVDGTYVL